MSDGKTHATFNTIVLGATVLIATQLPLPLAAGALAGSVAGLVVTPDCDLIGRTHEEARVYRYGGYLVGAMWEAFWRRYAKTHTHRGSSHRPFVGTYSRWLYVLKRLGWLIAIVLYYHHSFVMSHLFECFEFICFMFYFNVIQDLTHLALDKWHFHQGD